MSTDSYATGYRRRNLSCHEIRVSQVALLFTRRFRRKRGSLVDESDQPTRIPIDEPGAADPLILVVDLEIEIAQALRDADAQVDARVAGADDADLHGPLVLYRHILQRYRPRLDPALLRIGLGAIAQCGEYRAHRGLHVNCWNKKRRRQDMQKKG
jgi:hypothetical protein